MMIYVRCQSGLALAVRDRHQIFSPVDLCPPGTRIDPVETPLESCRADAGLRAGLTMIVDNQVEIVASVRPA